MEDVLLSKIALGLSFIRVCSSMVRVEAISVTNTFGRLCAAIDDNSNPRKASSEDS